MRPLLAATCLIAAAALVPACGGEDDPRAARGAPPVELDVEAPVDADVVRSGSVEVRGTVEPAGAAVRVLGEAAEVGGGTFTASVPLQPGSNVIDVIATAEGREPAMTAVRVTYQLPVPVPDLAGLTVEEAQEELEGVGLALEVERDDGWLDELLPGDPGVCEQDPEAGAEVPIGSLVRVLVKKSC